MTELNEGTLASLPSHVTTPAYNRAQLKAGIAHFGVGNFHRAHQAYYIDRCLALPNQQDWGIVGIGLSGGERGRKKADQFRSQDCLYSLTVAPAKGDTSVRVIGAQLDYLLAPEQPAEVLQLLTDPALRIVTLTITEGGYHVDPGSGTFVTDHADVAHDLTGNDTPRTVFGFVTEALARRRSAGTKPFTVVSCDNLRHNGEVARAAFVGFASALDQDLGAWIDSNVTFPNSLVDRITPSVSADDAARLNAGSGLADQIPVVAEDFSQWVIEDRFAGPRPRWEQVGAELVADVTPYETAKLRMLNGAHSALAYMGLERGHTYVHEAIADPALRAPIERLLRAEAATSFTPAPGQDLAAYADALLARFANPALEHRLIQIAMDGSQKIPQRWLATLADNDRTGRESATLRAALAAWLRHVRGDNSARWGPVDDPLAPALAARWREAGAAGVVEALFGPGGLLAASAPLPPSDRAAVSAILTPA
jgi:mannitol-1-phosphate/altronate dehydrogenase